MALFCTLFAVLVAMAALPNFAAADGCVVRRAAEVPLSMVAGFMIVSARLENTPVSLLLDTGAEAGLVTPDAATALALKGDPGHVSMMEGTGGAGGFTRNVLLRRLVIGGLTISNRSTPIGSLPAVPRIEPAVAGLIGADLLADYDVELDPTAGRMVLYTVAGICSAAQLLPWSGAYDAVPLRRGGDRLLAQVVVDGKALTALVDTGALSIILNVKAAERLGVRPEMLARDPGGLAGGIDMRPVAFHWHRFASFRIGQEIVNQPVITVSAFDEDEADVLLGASFFADRRVWLSYSQGRMFAQPLAMAR